MSNEELIIPVTSSRGTLMRYIYYFLAIPVLAVISATIWQPSEDEFQAAWNDARDYLASFNSKIELDQKVNKIAPVVKENARELGDFVSGPA